MDKVKAIDKVVKDLSVTSMPFVLCVVDRSDKKDTLQMYFWGSYKDKIACFSGVANMIMDDYVEDNGYIVHEDLRNVLDKTILLNDKRPNQELTDNVKEKLMELSEKTRQNRTTDHLSRSISPNSTENDVEDMIHALRCCEEVNCAECPRFMDEDEDGENKYTTLCNQALMLEAARMLEEFADGTRRSENE